MAGGPGKAGKGFKRAVGDAGFSSPGGASAHWLSHEETADVFGRHTQSHRPTVTQANILVFQQVEGSMGWILYSPRLSQVTMFVPL